MIEAHGYAARTAKSRLEPFSFERRDPGPKDVVIKILYTGICHSDIHQVRDEWGGARFPMVPGHEIAGKVVAKGAGVTRFSVGDLAGVGCMVDSCRVCPSCQEGEEQFCDYGPVWTYNSVERDGKTPTYGGYSNLIVVSEDFVLRLPDNLPLSHVAPLLCAGITTYSPLRRFRVREGMEVGVVGLGGLGHMAIKFARAMGARVTVFSTSPAKESDARKLGAHDFLLTKKDGWGTSVANRFDLMVDAVSADHDLAPYLGALRKDGSVVLLGVPEKPLAFHSFLLISRRRNLTASLIGGIRETQEMLDYCGQKDIVSDIEMIPIQKVNEAYERTLKGDVKYRFVIDMATLDT
ncbi:MAG: NAD(P)-dependent alcohol dehydrogenase [Nitrospiraceae bacterium]|nr:NAD(P)-dependent alcohol dehydrogenase [Nitrospiraceae bacterium]